MSTLLPIGDFSRMTYLTVKALRLYHERGLLAPVQVDPSSGYRYYSPDQVPIAQVIRRLCLRLVSYLARFVSWCVSFSH
ncbi:MerR family transcriptional regulator [Mycolicibacter minnesotensis]